MKSRCWMVGQLAAMVSMLGALSLGTAANAEAVPANDDFLAAAPLSGPPLSVEFDANEGASKQAGEPEHVGDSGGHSVWYSWTPSVNARVVLSTCTINTGIDTLLAVYTGPAVDDLTPVASNDERAEARCHPTDSEVAFDASAGTTYRIAVDGKGGSEGEFELVLKGPAPNDEFGNAATIESDTSVSGTTVLATRQIGEPNHAGFVGAHSVWYSWTPSASGEAVVSTCVFFGQLDTLLAVYTGSGVDDLAPVAGSDDGEDGCGSWTDSEVAFDASAGTTYRIAVDGKDGSEGDFKLLLQGPPESEDEGPGEDGDDVIAGEPAASPPPPALPVAPASALSPRPKPLRCKPGQRKRRLRGKVRCVKKRGKHRKPVTAT